LRGNAEERRDPDSSFSEHRIDFTAKLKASERNYMVKIICSGRGESIVIKRTGQFKKFPLRPTQPSGVKNKQDSISSAAIFQRQVDQIQQQSSSC
jgi:hypothetical protein